MRSGLVRIYSDATSGEYEACALALTESLGRFRWEDLREIEQEFTENQEQYCFVEGDENWFSVSIEWPRSDEEYCPEPAIEIVRLEPQQVASECSALASRLVLEILKPASREGE